MGSISLPLGLLKIESRSVPDIREASVDFAKTDWDIDGSKDKFLSIACIENLKKLTPNYAVFQRVVIMLQEVLPIRQHPLILLALLVRR